MLDELEVLVLDVLGWVGWDAVGREEPVQIPGPGPVEPELDRRPCGGGEQAGLEVDLQVDHQVESPASQLAARPPELAGRRQAAAPVKDDELVDRRVVGDQPVGNRLDDPGEVEAGRGALQGVGDRKDVDGVTDRAEHDDRDPSPVGDQLTHRGRETRRTPCGSTPTPVP